MTDGWTDRRVGRNSDVDILYENYPPLHGIDLQCSLRGARGNLSLGSAREVKLTVGNMNNGFSHYCSVEISRTMWKSIFFISSRPFF